MPSAACSPCPPTWRARRPLTSESVAARLPSASELAECLPDWTKTIDRAVSPDYACLKEAAIALAGASERARRSLVEAYDQAYCQIRLPVPQEYCAAIGGGWHDAWFGDGVHTTRSDQPRASGMYLLLRVLFVLPTRYPGDSPRQSAPWGTRYPGRDRYGGGSSSPLVVDVAWPVHEQPSAHLLLIDRCPHLAMEAAGQFPAISYHAWSEYAWFTAHFPRRTPAEIEALDIRPVNDDKPSAAATGEQEGPDADRLACGGDDHGH